MRTPFQTGGDLPHGSGPARIIGVTGGRGSGKSEVGKILTNLGLEVIDSDHLTHQILNSPCNAYNEVLAHFGADLVSEQDGPINRDLLRERALKDDESKAALEAIMHPEIEKRLESTVTSLSDVDILFVQVPLLHEVGWGDHFDQVWCVVADEAVRLRRVMDRDHCDESTARALIAHHGLTQEEKADRSDRVIDNSSTVAILEEQVRQLVDEVRCNLTGKPASAVADTESDHYRDLLRRFAQLAAEEALTRLGNVATTEHKGASARMTLDVDACDGEHTGGEHPHLNRSLEVEVNMSVRNKSAGSAGDGCSCGCGKTCRVTCACPPDCGCGCKRPVDPPKPPNPPQPPAPSEHSHGSRQWLYALLGLFGLLAFLFAVLVWYHEHSDHPVVSGGTPTKVVIINEIPGCCDKPEPPVVVDPGPSDPPFTEPTPPPSGDPIVVPPATKQVLDEPPGYAFRFLHNAVRVKVVGWEVGHDAHCNGPWLKGYDADGRILVHQVYDPHYWMVYQWVFSYHPDGSVQIDRFEGRQNQFVGRTIYSYNQYGGVESIELYDGLQRKLMKVTLSRKASGAVTALYVTEYDPATTAERSKKVVEGVDSADKFLHDVFYLYGDFGKVRR